AGAKFLLHEALVVQHDRQRRPGNRRHRISTPTPPPNARFADRSALMGRRKPAAWIRIKGSTAMYVLSLIHPGLTNFSSHVPAMTPGTNPMMMGMTRERTAGSFARFTQSTLALSTTSSSTSAGFNTRLVKKNSARGTVIDENPYPSAPLIVAATR